MSEERSPSVDEAEEVAGPEPSERPDLSPEEIERIKAKSARHRPTPREEREAREEYYRERRAMERNFERMVL